MPENPREDQSLLPGPQHTRRRAKSPHHPLPEESALHTAAQLAARLQVSPRTIWIWVHEGLPCERYSPQIVRFDIAACRAWLMARQAAKTAQEKQSAGLHPPSAALR